MCRGHGRRTTVGNRGSARQETGLPLSLDRGLCPCLYRGLRRLHRLRIPSQASIRVRLQERAAASIPKGRAVQAGPSLRVRFLKYCSLPTLWTGAGRTPHPVARAARPRGEARQVRRHLRSLPPGRTPNSQSRLLSCRLRPRRWSHTFDSEGSRCEDMPSDREPMNPGVSRGRESPLRSLGLGSNSRLPRGRGGCRLRRCSGPAASTRYEARCLRRTCLLLQSRC